MTVPIALDAMGGDFAPAIPVEAAVTAAAAGAEVILVGQTDAIERELSRLGTRPATLRIAHAPDQVEMGDKAAKGVRSQRGTSLYVGCELVKRGEAAAFVTMGNTGAAMATALVVLGRLKGVERPALGAVLSTGSGVQLFLDVGANADARPSHLVQFAHLGSAYLQAVHGVARPRVGLLSIGEEPSKGSALVVETHEALAASDLHFIGNVEGRVLLSDEVDVVVTDGFTGNVCLKLAEGLAGMIFGQLRSAAGSSLRAKLGAGLLLPSLQGVRDRLDYRRYGAVPLLGVDGGVFIGHGRSDASAVVTALGAANDAVESGMLEAMAASIEAALTEPPVER